MAPLTNVPIQSSALYPDEKLEAWRVGIVERVSSMTREGRGSAPWAEAYREFAEREGVIPLLAVLGVQIKPPPEPRPKFGAYRG